MKDEITRVDHPSSFPFHPLEHLIVLAVHAHPPVDLLRGRIAAVDVESDAANVPIALGDLLHVVVQTRVDTAPSMFGPDVNALDPPHHSVAPVTPLERDHQRCSEF